MPGRNDPPVNRPEKPNRLNAQLELDLPSIVPIARLDEEPFAYERADHLANGGCSHTELSPQVALASPLELAALNHQKHLVARRSQPERLEKVALKSEPTLIGAMQREENGVHRGA